MGLQTELSTGSIWMENHVCIWTLPGALYKLELWPLFSSQKILLHRHTIKFMSCLKKNNNNPVELAILYLHSHITIIRLQKLWPFQSLLLGGITSCLFHSSSSSLFYICFLISLGIWICNIQLANNSLPGWLEFILRQLFSSYYPNEKKLK